MRMWMVDPKLMCRKHLLGEHVEIHMLVGSIQKNKSLKGFVDNGLIEVHSIYNRHDELVSEMSRRGYNHKSELPDIPLFELGYVDVENSLNELNRRCPECSKRIKENKDV